MATQSGKSWKRGLFGLGVAAITAGGVASGARAGDLSTETPQQVLKSAISALKGADSFEMHARYHGGGSSLDETLVASKHNDLALEIRQGKIVATLVVVDKKLYLHGSPSYWTAAGSTKSFAKLLAPRWYKVPAGKLGHLTGATHKLTSSALTQCLAHDTQGMTNAGDTTVNGHAAVLLKGPGTAPGTHPETIAVAATGTPFLLRIAVTGPAKPGPIGTCNNPETAKQTGIVTANHWNSAPAVKAPAHAVALPSKGL